MKRSHQGNIETLKAGDETIAKQLAKLIQNAANNGDIFQERNIKYIKNYRPI